MRARYLIAWLVMLLVSILNGAVRDFTYGKHLSGLLAHQLSTLSGILLLGMVIWTYMRRWPFASARQALNAGLLWMALTVAFEFLFFHYVGGHSWNALLANYDLSAGRLWPLVLLWVGFSPLPFSPVPLMMRAVVGIYKEVQCGFGWMPMRVPRLSRKSCSARLSGGRFR